MMDKNQKSLTYFTIEQFVLACLIAFDSIKQGQMLKIANCEKEAFFTLKGPLTGLQVSSAVFRLNRQGMNAIEVTQLNGDFVFTLRTQSRIMELNPKVAELVTYLRRKLNISEPKVKPSEPKVKPSEPKVKPSELKVNLAQDALNARKVVLAGQAERELNALLSGLEGQIKDIRRAIVNVRAEDDVIAIEHAKACYLPEIDQCSQLIKHLTKLNQDLNKKLAALTAPSVAVITLPDGVNREAALRVINSALSMISDLHCA